MSETGAGQPNLGIPGIDSIVEVGRSPSHTTYRVRDVATGRTVVVKLLNAGREWPGLEERFDREQSALAQLVGHPNIVPVYGHGWTETGMPYVVTAEETGGSIGDRLRGPTPMTGPDILALGVRLAGALESAHRVGVVHGDLRPDDMMINDQGEPLLADFGIVTLIRPNAAGVTDPQELAHVSPELLDGQPASPSSDVYALASALFTLFAGEPAYVHRGETSVIPVIKRIASDPLPDLAAKGVPQSVAEAIGKAMSKDPADRHHSTQDFGRALQQSQVALGLPMTDMTLLGTAAADPRTTLAGAAGGGGAGAIAGAAAAGAAGGAGAPASPVAATGPAGGPPGGPPGAGGPPPGPGGPPGAPASGKSKAPLIIAAVVVLALIIGAIAFFATRGGNDNKNASAESETTTTAKKKTTTTSSQSTDQSTDSASSSSVTTVTDANGNLVLQNDGGQITVSVPSNWTDVNPKTASTNSRPSLIATENQNTFEDGSFATAGIEVVVFAPGDALDPNDLDGSVKTITSANRTGGSLDSVCTAGTPTDGAFGNGTMIGRQVRLTGCKGQGDVIIVAATNAAKAFTMAVEVHLGVPPDEAGAQTALSTVNVVKFP